MWNVERACKLSKVGFGCAAEIEDGKLFRKYKWIRTIVRIEELQYKIFMHIRTYSVLRRWNV